MWLIIWTTLKKVPRDAEKHVRPFFFFFFFLKFKFFFFFKIFFDNGCWFKWAGFFFFWVNCSVDFCSINFVDNLYWFHCPCLIYVLMTWPLARIGHLSLSIIVWGSMCNLSFSKTFFLMWVSLYLGHRCSELRLFLGEFFFDEYKVSVCPHLPWKLLVKSLFYWILV